MTSQVTAKLASHAAAYVLLCLLVSSPSTVFSQFTFSFDTLATGTYSMNCGPGSPNLGCTGPNGPNAPFTNATLDNSRFAQGSVTIDGQVYAHQIITDATSGFSFEIFVLSSKAGPGCGGLICMTAGAATQNPTAVAMKLVNSSSSANENFYDEFLKEEIAMRAKIRQDISSGNMNSIFEMDARSVSLTEIPTAPPPMINIINIHDSTIPVTGIGPDTNFDMFVDSVKGNIEGGSSYFVEDPSDPRLGHYEFINFD